MPQREADRIRQLQDLCDQAEKLKDAAEKLCRELAVQIDRTRTQVNGSEPRVERRRKPRR